MLGFIICSKVRKLNWKRYSKPQGTQKNYEQLIGKCKELKSLDTGRIHRALVNLWKKPFKIITK